MTSKPPQKPLMIYDGECRFCCASIERWREETGEQIDYAPYQEAASRLPEISASEFRKSVYLIEPDGTLSRAARAVLRTMSLCGRKRWLYWMYRVVPGFGLVADLLYGCVARLRYVISSVLRVWWGKALKPPKYHISSALFLRGLGLVYFIAIMSLWIQLEGLIGSNGIIPAAEHLERMGEWLPQQEPPRNPYREIPTLAWLNSSDAFLHGLCLAGVICSVLLIVGLAPMPMLIALWVLYLSLFHAGQMFLSFQWDILLLETGFVAIFLAPGRWWAGLFPRAHPPRLVLFLLLWLLFRVLFESGAVKLTWNDHALGPDGTPVWNAWEALKAMDFHYWTQPLPVWTSWYAAKLPDRLQGISVVAVFIIELLVPFFIFGPRFLRVTAFALISVFMGLIAATGNYTFFNVLTLLLTLLLLDDRCWPRFMRKCIESSDPPWLARPTRWRSAVLVPFAVVALLIGSFQVMHAAFPAAHYREPLESKLGIRSVHLVNGYGLFRRMTETRPEIVVEGSLTGRDWTAYEFRWKAGDLSRAPGFNTPHQPRLDWQMWFEALRFERVHRQTKQVQPNHMSPWFQRFLLRLMEGSPDVLALLGENPFPDAATKYVRVALYQYRFTTQDEREATGDWWHREFVWKSDGFTLP